MYNIVSPLTLSSGAPHLDGELDLQPLAVRLRPDKPRIHQLHLRAEVRAEVRVCAPVLASVCVLLCVPVHACARGHPASTYTTHCVRMRWRARP